MNTTFWEWLYVLNRLIWSSAVSEVILLAKQDWNSEVNTENTSNFPSQGYCGASGALCTGVVLSNTNTSLRRCNPSMTLGFQLQPLLRTEESSIYSTLKCNGGHAVAQLVDTLRYKLEGRGFDSRWYHWNFSLTSFRPQYNPGVDSASNRNEYQESNHFYCSTMMHTIMKSQEY
jgi:hypothetical protein